MLLKIGVFFSVILILVGVAIATTTKSNNYDGSDTTDVYSVSALSSVTNSTSVTPSKPRSNYSVEFTRTGTGSMIVTLQRTIKGSVFANVTPQMTLVTANPGSLFNDVTDSPATSLRVHVVSGADATNTVSATVIVRPTN